MRVINVHEAKTHLSKLLDQVKAGEEHIIGKHGKPYARLVPYDEGERPLGLLRHYLSEDALQRLGDGALAPTDEDTLLAWEGQDD